MIWTAPHAFDVLVSAEHGLFAWTPLALFAMFQLKFAIITPALIVGAIAERMKFSAILLFVTLWMLVVYFPLAHMVWGANGFMNGVWNPKATIRKRRREDRNRADRR